MGQHQACVRKTAFNSLTATKFVPEEEAIEAIDKVFDKCYADLEPLGRRAFNLKDVMNAISESEMIRP